MNCGQVQPKLSCYLDGVLDEATLEAVESHLAACADCREELEALRSVVGLTSEIFEVEPPAELAACIKDAVARERETAGECTQYVVAMSAYVDGELEEAAWLGMKAHVDSCEHCAAELMILQSTLESMTLMAEVDPPSSLRGRIAAATTGARKPVRIAAFREWVGSILAPPRVAWTAGAAAILAVGILAHSQKTQPPNAAVAPATPPPVVAQSSEPEVTVEESTTAEKAVASAVQKSVERARVKVQVRVTGNTLAVQEEKPAHREPMVSHHPAHSPALAAEPESPSGPEATPDGEKIALKPVDKPADADTAKPKETNMKIAIDPTVKLEQTEEFFKDIEVTAQMKRRVDDSLRVDVINSKF